jgi:Uma2 family endonuclease
MVTHIPYPRMPATVVELEAVSEANPGWKVELEADGSLTMSPTFTVSGLHDAALYKLLFAWTESAGGWVFPSSTGFTMPNGAILSPDASWISAERWSAVTIKERKSYTRIVPDICIEMASETDRILRLTQKLRRFREHGASYVLLIDPWKRTIWSDGERPADFPTDFSSVFDAVLS